MIFVHNVKGHCLLTYCIIVFFFFCWFVSFYFVDHAALNCGAGKMKVQFFSVKTLAEGQTKVDSVSRTPHTHGLSLRGEGKSSVALGRDTLSLSTGDPHFCLLPLEMAHCCGC